MNALIQASALLALMLSGGSVSAQQAQSVLQQVNAEIAAEQSCTQWCEIRPVGPDGITVPTSSIPLPQLDPLPAPAAYSVFDAPKF